MPKSKRWMRPQFRNTMVTQPNVLLVEGKNDAILFHELVGHLQLGQIQIVESVGKDNFSKTLSRIAKNTNDFRLQRVKSIGVIGDADEDARIARRDICQALYSVGLSGDAEELYVVPGKPEARILILPGNDDPGALESVCLESVQDDIQMPCVEEFSACVESKWETSSVSKFDKMKAHAFLATRYDNPELRLGEAAEERIWPFDHEAFEEVRDFLQRLVELPK